jgi:hypothetical protein
MVEINIHREFFGRSWYSHCLNPAYGGATFFTLYFRFVKIRYFISAIQVGRGKHDDLEGEVEKQEDIPDTIKGEIKKEK